ncbi:MAG: penicillin-insensitive murein endopeptidase [Hyphomicrobiaceae bacterium]
MRRAIFAIAISMTAGVPALPAVAADAKAPAAPAVAAQGSPVSPAPLASDTGAKAAEKKIDPRPVAAKTVFGAIRTPSPLAARSIGFYSRGCLAGAKALPVNGETWQVMRLSRNRNWGHPALLKIVERLAEDGAAKDGWPGLLVGDIAQPRGGPMLTGHNSHQIGLDADIWLTPMPERRLTATEREQLSATSMLGKDDIHADKEVFTPYHAAIIRRAASYPEVERVLVHPGIKKAMCEEKGADRRSFHKIRPYWGHHYHMHIRISCPPGSTGCRTQAPTPADDGCGKEIDDWLALLQKPLKPEPPVQRKPQPPRIITLDDLPPDCRIVAGAGNGDAATGKRPVKTRSAKSP